MVVDVFLKKNGSEFTYVMGSLTLMYAKFQSQRKIHLCVNYYIYFLVLSETYKYKFDINKHTKIKVSLF